MQTCPDTLHDHYYCAMRAQDSQRLSEAEEHFRRALELAGDQPSFGLANVLIYYGWMLIRMGRVDEGIALVERRLALPRFSGEDRLERRCTTEQLAAFKADRDAGRPVGLIRDYSSKNPFDTPMASVPPERLLDHMAALKAYLLATPDPNAANADGQTCLVMALGFCVGEDGENIVASLLERGADPNRPSAMTNFSTFMTTAKRVSPLEKLIKAGLKLNDVYTVEPGLLPTGRGGRITLLDYALNVEAYLNKRAKSKAFVRTVEKYAGPLSGRRRFVADVIELLKANGGRSAADE